MIEPCGGTGVHIPENNCDDCEQLAERLAVLERLLDGLERIEFTQTDTNGTQYGVFLGEVNDG